jgi:hypothetical protein
MARTTADYNNRFNVLKQPNSKSNTSKDGIRVDFKIAKQTINNIKQVGSNNASLPLFEH